MEFSAESTIRQQIFSCLPHVSCLDQSRLTVNIRKSIRTNQVIGLYLSNIYMTMYWIWYGIAANHPLPPCRQDNYGKEGICCSYFFLCMFHMNCKYIFRIIWYRSIGMCAVHVRIDYHEVAHVLCGIHQRKSSNSYFVQISRIESIGSLFLFLPTRLSYSHSNSLKTFEYSTHILILCNIGCFQCQRTCHSITAPIKMAKRNTHGQHSADNKYLHWKKHSSKPNTWLVQNERNSRTP